MEGGEGDHAIPDKIEEGNADPDIPEMPKEVDAEPDNAEKTKFMSRTEYEKKERGSITRQRGRRPLPTGDRQKHGQVPHPF